MVALDWSILRVLGSARPLRSSLKQSRRPKVRKFLHIRYARLF